jgi:hypothetical protein
LIEAGGELGVAVAKEELGLEGAILEFRGQVPSVLSDPLGGGISGNAGEVDLATLEFEPGKETVLPPPPPLRVK